MNGRLKNILIILALPVYQIANIVAYANTRQGWVAKIGTAITFLPIFILTTTIWAMCWAIGAWLLWQTVH